jgi:fatty-acyl-CoA synthase
MIGQILSINAERHADQTAVVFGSKRHSYAELNKRACRVASALLDMKVEPGDRVATLMNNCNHLIDLFFATAKLGVILVPVNFRLAAREVEVVLQNCAPKILFVGHSLHQTVAELAGSDALPKRTVAVPDRIALTDVSDNEYERWLATYRDSEPDVSVRLNDVHLLVHSSGTTGQPKAAVWKHATTLNCCCAKIIDFSITSSDSSAVFGPLFHVGPLMDIAMPLLLCGGKLVIGESSGFDPHNVLRTASDEQVTLLTIYPTMWRRVIQEVDPLAYDLSRLRLLLTGGEPMPVSLLREVYARFPHAGFINTYGSTEAGPITTFLAPADNIRKIGAVGKPAFGVQLKIVGESDQVVPCGEVGELLVRSPFVCEGYWNQPEATAASLLDDWWRTGDLASQDSEGFIWIRGRKKDMIISGAENIYPAEVEQTISTLSGVREVSVVGVPDDVWGEAVAAFIVKEPDSDLDASRVIEHCKSRLASYKKPRHVRFVDSLPRTTVNKVSKVVLRKQF